MSKLYTEEHGTGAPILLIHGFPFNLKLWTDFVPRLSHTFRVITVDLPGFGKSPALKTPFQLGQVADTLSKFIDGKNLGKVAVVGHSLGGYVALELIKKYSDRFSSLVLFHSTAYADAEEKKESRTKVVEFVNKNGAEPFTTGFIPPLFANPSHPSIEIVKEIARQASAEAVIGYTLAMRDRPEQIKTLERFENPTLFLAGAKDPGIPVDSVLKQATHCQKPQIDILNDVAHMGMFEKPAETAEKIKVFLAKTHA